MHPDEAIARLAETQFGHVARSQALSFGLSEGQIRHRIHVGRWRVVHRTVYRVGGAGPTLEGAAIAAQLATGDTYVGSLTAARLWRMSAAESGSAVDLITASDRRVRLQGVVLKRTTTLTKRDVTHLGPIAITTPVRTLVDLASVLGANHLEAALDDALRRGLVSLAALDRRIAGLRGLGDLRGLVAERRVAGATESELERRFVRILRGARLPDPVRQHVVLDPAGSFVARVDFAYPNERVAIEVDGYAYHSSRERFDADRERDHRLRECGWLPLRFTSRHLDDAEGIVRRVKDARNWSRTVD